MNRAFYAVMVSLLVAVTLGAAYTAATWALPHLVASTALWEGIGWLAAFIVLVIVAGWCAITALLTLTAKNVFQTLFG